MFSCVTLPLHFSTHISHAAVTQEGVRYLYRLFNIICVSVCCVCSDDEDDEEHLDWLSIAPEMDEPEEPGWGQLEVS